MICVRTTNQRLLVACLSRSGIPLLRGAENLVALTLYGTKAASMPSWYVEHCRSCNEFGEVSVLVSCLFPQSACHVICRCLSAAELPQETDCVSPKEQRKPQLCRASMSDKTTETLAMWVCCLSRYLVTRTEQKLLVNRRTEQGKRFISSTESNAYDCIPPREEYVRNRQIMAVLGFLSEILSRHTSEESAVDVAAI